MLRRNALPLLFLGLFYFYSCNSNSQELASQEPIPKPSIQSPIWSPIDSSGSIIKDRFVPPRGFDRVSYPDNSFAAFLQQLPLKPSGSRVKYYNGAEKAPGQVYLAVVDMDVGKRDLQQCADAVMRLRGEYLYGQERYDDIRFDLTNGFDMAFAKWRQGYRIKVSGNTVSWIKTKSASYSYGQFRSYMNMVFAYAGTLSLARELNAVPVEDIQVGDVLIQGGSPGHAVIVVDMAINKAGEKRFLLAQSYMPAQEIQVLQDPKQASPSPWYALPPGERLETPEWNFTVHDLKRF